MTPSKDDGATWDVASAVHVWHGTGGYSTLGAIRKLKEQPATGDARRWTSASGTDDGDDDVAVLFEIDTCTVAIATFSAGLFGHQP